MTIMDREFQRLDPSTTKQQLKTLLSPKFSNIAQSKFQNLVAKSKSDLKLKTRDTDTTATDQPGEYVAKLNTTCQTTIEQTRVRKLDQVRIYVE